MYKALLVQLILANIFSWSY